MAFLSSSVVFGQLTTDSSRSDNRAKALFENLKILSKNNTLIGHQDDLAYGVHWQYIEGNSDIKDVVGEYPAFFGWDLGHIETGKNSNLDGVPFELMRDYIIKAYEMGTVISLSWHANNPLTGGSSWDTTSYTVSSILPGASNHAKFKTWLDCLSDFLLELKTENGELIPILFRPYHELTGNWFWWCKNVCTSQEYIELWRFTVDYLRNTKQLTHILMVYNVAEIYSSTEFYERYPGDDVVDVISIDTYQQGSHETRQQFVTKLRSFLSILQPIAQDKGKILAIGETGYECIPDPEWWTKAILPSLEGFDVAWVLFWRNHGFMAKENKMHYYVPFEGHSSEQDFVKFYNDPRTLFQKGIESKKIYNRKEHQDK
ncbi:glycoside hydrolase family 26 protein [Sphingobacterium faecale]|uniref:Mannan endo-1,4-beta-mannosidase n=1 Tax=Sphingobacterium faecale TaxID=2803775 RepID=A0ABS1R3A6_9SPHI|nr:glycosyl hydrolase [Sphingobacterium faecale]MBL1409190.1 beta-mannosidase [Sphingobacterium faecale]